ncbi:MAG: helix-turn-helix domain-containing protein [Acidimicrobiaceae bacterium]|nr:helix-turn-helix domain-containing protein [Acidimicrobiaceae bacterium]
MRISLYPDRFEVASPGGLHGIHAGYSDVAQLIDSSISSTRNALLARLLEDVVIPGTGRPVCENRGSGLRAAVQALERAGMGPPELNDLVRELVVTVRDQFHRFVVPPLEDIPGRMIGLLEAGPRSSVDLAAALGASKQTVLNWLRRLRADGIVAPTHAEPRTRGNKWKLTSQP